MMVTQRCVDGEHGRCLLAGLCACPCHGRQHGGARRGAGAPPGSRLPRDQQARIATALGQGLPISEIARGEGVSRDRVRTIKYALRGMTVAQGRKAAP